MPPRSQTTDVDTDAAVDDAVVDELIRLSVNITPETARELENLARDKHITKTEALRRAIAAAHYIDTATRDSKTKVLLREPDGEIRELIFL